MILTATVTPAPAAIVMDSAALFRLLAWISPRFPVGAYSYSHGIDYAVACGAVCDAATPTDWIAAIVEFGAGRSDATLFCAAWRAATAGDAEGQRVVTERATALRGTAELGLETAAQGHAFAETQGAAWPSDAPFEPRAERALAYQIAVARACAAHGVPLVPGLEAYLHAFAANLTSAGVRLVPLGQTQGQRVLASLEAPIHRAVADALAAPLDEAGSAAWMVDWCSMNHENQHTRLFRS